MSEVLLLLLAGALLVSGIEKLIALDVLPALVDPVWNTSGVLDDSGRIGGLVASFTGYRARPALMPLLALAAYWALVWFFFWRAPGRVVAAPASATPAIDPLPRAERH